MFKKRACIRKSPRRLDGSVHVGTVDVRCLRRLRYQGLGKEKGDGQVIYGSGFIGQGVTTSEKQRGLENK